MTFAGSPGGSTAVGGTSGGKVYVFNNLGTSPVVVAPQHVRRVGIAFHNPGTVTLYIGPTMVQAVNTVANTLTDTPLVPSLSALGGMILLAPGATFFFSGECQHGYQAIAASGSTNPLTVLDTDV